MCSKPNARRTGGPSVRAIRSICGDYLLSQCSSASCAVFAKRVVTSRGAGRGTTSMLGARWVSGLS
jgi:hypothetical protein